MNKESNCIIITKIGLGILSFLINLGFVIAGSIILAQTNNLSSNSEFSNVWICNLVLTIFSGIAALILLNRCCQSDELKNNNSELIATLGSLGVSIWALILYFEETNLNSLKDESNELFMLFTVRIYFTLVGFGMIGIVLIISIILCCYELNQDNTNNKQEYTITSENSIQI